MQERVASFLCATLCKNLFTPLQKRFPRDVRQFMWERRTISPLQDTLNGREKMARQFMREANELEAPLKPIRANYLEKIRHELG